MYTMYTMKIKIAAFCLILFLIVSLTVNFGMWRGIDLQTTIFLQSVLSRQIDLPFSLFSLLGSFEVTAAIFALLVLLIFIFRKRIWWQAIISFTTLLGIEVLGKKIIFQSPPPIEFFRYTLPWFFPTAHVKTSYAFPSGHTARTVFLTVLILGILFQKKLSRNQKIIVFIAAIVFDFLMFVSRVYLGEHWVADVLGGILLAGGLALFTLSIPQLKKSKI